MPLAVAVGMPEFPGRFATRPTGPLLVTALRGEEIIGNVSPGGSPTTTRLRAAAEKTSHRRSVGASGAGGRQLRRATAAAALCQPHRIFVGTGSQIVDKVWRRTLRRSAVRKTLSFFGCCARGERRWMAFSTDS